jgi:hypothetical protein
MCYHRRHTCHRCCPCHRQLYCQQQQQQQQQLDLCSGKIMSKQQLPR